MLISLQRHRIALGALLSLWSVSDISANTAVAPFPNDSDPAQAPLFVENRLMPDDVTPFWRRVVSREPKHQELASRAQFFVNAVMTRWSGTNPAGVAGFDALYAAKIDYFGKQLSRDAVLADKRRFAKRWPERTYKIQSSYAECNASECFVDGYVEWETRSPARKTVASGVAGFSYVLLPLGDAFVIKRENSNVRLRRNQIPSQPGFTVAKEAQIDERERASQSGFTVDREDQRERTSQLGLTVAREAQSPQSPPGNAVAKEARPDESERPFRPGLTVATKAHLDERKPPSQLVASGAQPDEQEAVRQWDLSLTAVVALLHVLDFRFVCAALILVGLLLWRATKWEWRKSKTKTEAQPKRQAKQEVEKQAKQNLTSSRVSPWDHRDQSGPTGPRIAPEAQQHDSEKQQEAERRQEREAERRRRQAEQRENERRRRQAEQEREADRERRREREHALKGQIDEWWSVLEVSSDASKNEIVRSYRRKIQRCHPDRVSGLAPEFVSLAENRTKALNAAYAEAMRACRGGAQQS